MAPKEAEDLKLLAAQMEAISEPHRRLLLSEFLAKRNELAHKKGRESIFISHSREDLADYVKPAARKIRSAGLDAYVASLRLTGKNPAEKIVEAISSSKALFAIITRSVSENRETRDWVMFEMGVAKALRKPVFGWKTPRATVPEPVKQITDYFVFDPNQPKDIRQMLQTMGNLAKTV